MDMAKIPQDFSEFLKLLEDEGAQYLLIGGMAVAYYGYPRATADMDIWVAADPGNAAKCVKVLQRFGMDVPELTPALFCEPGKIIRMGVPPIRIELHTGLSGVAFAECFQRRRRVSFYGQEINLIDLEDLKRNKRAARRHRDLEDLEHLPES